MKKNILIVDDEQNIRNSLKEALEDVNNYFVEMAINGEEAIQKIKNNKYHVVLLDIKLPGINGIEVLEKIKELNYNTNVIMITGYGSIESAIKTMKLGAIDYLTKPFKTEKVKEIISEVLVNKNVNKTGAKSNFDNYEDIIIKAKSEIENKNYDIAKDYITKALAIDLERPETFNLLGVINDLKNNQHSANKMYKVALVLDPSYEPANYNLNRDNIEEKTDIESFNLGDDITGKSGE